MMTLACIIFFIISIVCINGQSDRKSSLTFVIDVTNSMEIVRRQVEQHANAIFDTVAASNNSFIDNFVLVTFADTDKYKTSVNNVTDTKDRDVFKGSLKLNLISGGDCPEYSMSGILTGIENSAPGSTIYVFTDASAKDYKVYDVVKDKAQKKEIQIVFILTDGKCDFTRHSHKGYDVYEDLARDTSGQVISLHKTSIGEIIKYIQDNTVARRIYLAAKSYPPGKGLTLYYTTDRTTTNTTISISCSDVSVNITGPDNNTLVVTNLVKLENITVLKVNETKIGVQTVTIKCKSNSRIIVTAKSDIQFRHGFSAFVPTSINDTTVKPTPDGQTHLLIKVVGNFLPKSARLLDASDELIIDGMLLKALDDTKILFLTEPFFTPFIMFRIVITGVNLDYNETISRIGNTLVEPQIPGTDDTPQKKPNITIEGGFKISVKVDTPLQLKCTASAYPRPNITWERNGKVLETDVFDYELPYVYGSVHKIAKVTENATYECKAENIKGIDKQSVAVELESTVVKMLTEAPIIEKITRILHFEEGTNAKICCSIKQGIPKPSIHWYYKEKVTSIFAEIKEAANKKTLSLTNVTRNQDGTYKCNAINLIGNDTLESTLVVEYGPTVDDDSESMTVEAGEEITLPCSAEGVPEPVVTWHKDGKPLIGSKFLSSSNHRLIFKPDLGDNGEYKCDASNKLGSDSKIILVKVEKSPTVLIVESGPIDAEYDMPLKITCEVVGYPKPDIVWINTSSKAELEADVEEKSPYKFVSCLNIEKIISNATYQCKARNTRGVDETKVTVKTVRKPFFKVLESPKDITYDIAYNTTAKYLCQADAYPPAEVNWYKNGDILSKDDISVSSDGFVLTIKHMQPNDIGNFKCEIKNIHHIKTFTFKIKISGVAKPIIDAFSKTLYISEKSDTKISCRIEEGTPKPTIQWHFKDKVTNIFVEIKEAKDQEDLSLTNIKRKDQGTYKCLATNVAGSDLMESDLVVEYAPTIHNDTESITALVDSKVILTCLADGFPTPDVEWSKDGAPVTDSKFATSADYSLIFNVDLDDKGVYKCSASNTLGTAIKNVTIEVEKPPAVIIEGYLKQKVDFNEALYLKCNVIGNPPPDIRWIDITNRIVLSGSTSTVKSPYEYLSILSIDKVNKNATYQCEAKNAHGDDRASVVVEAVIKNHFYVTEKPKDTIIAYNTEGNLYCNVDAYPSAKITWLYQTPFGRSHLTSKDNVKISSDGSTLTFKNMQPNQQGVYYCKASNIDNEITSMAKVTISGVEIPKIYKTPKEQIIRNYLVKEGDSVLLTCKIVRGTPKPTIKWHFKNKHSRKFIEVKTAKNQETLLVNDVHRDDNAMYACQADNFMGSDSLKMDIQVEYSPSIKDDKKNYVVEAGGEVNIPCSVDGKPEPLVKWTKDPGTSKFAPTADHSFRLITNTGDSGDYTCTATNKYGTVTRTVHIEVYSIRVIHRGEKKQYRDEYEPLELECYGKGKPKPAIKWLFEGTIEEPKIPPEILLDDSNELEIDELKFEQRGRYTCVAYNNLGGHATFTYEIDVYNEVKIHNRVKIIRAVDGDMALRIHCNATGNPKPYYNWIIDGVPRRDGDTIFLKDVNKKTHDSSEVHCEAVNDNDSRARFEFNVVVDDYPSLNNPNFTLKGESGTVFPVACPIPHEKGDYLRWYKDKKKIHEGELYIRDAKTSDTGSYTCRVSNFVKTESANVILKVGSKLKFMNTPVKTTHSLGLGEKVNLDCVVIGDPIPKVSWYFNGKLISTSVSYRLVMDQAKVGMYKCEATNDVDSIFRTFDVTLSECLLKIDPNAKKQPLISTQYFSWPSYKYDAGYLYMPKYQTVLLICQKPSKFNVFDYNFVYAYCNQTGNTAQLHIDQRPYDYSDLQCTEDVRPKVKWTGKTCLGDDSERVKISYEVLHKTIDVYEVCMDLSYDIPFYTKQNLRLPLADSIPKAITWFNDRFYKYDFDKLYDAMEQTRGISRSMRRRFHDFDHCAFSKKQLVNPLDVFPGLPERATFTHLNVVPHWSTCSSENWDDVESRVRSLSQSTGDELVVWTGTAQILNLIDSFRSSVEIFIFNQADATSLPVSTYLWKVVQNPRKGTSLAIIQLNIPDITKTEVRKYVKCKDICPYVNWMSGNQWSNVSRGYTFCCLLSDFKYKFGYPSLFGTSMDNLLQQ